MSEYFTKDDLIKGLTSSFFLNLIDDVKWRDTFGKLVQYSFKTSAAFLTDFQLLDDKTRSSTAIQLNTAAGHISLARRLFRFIRWTRNVSNFFADVSTNKPTIVALFHASASIAACICEDITTLGKIGLVPPSTADRFAMPGNYFWLTESITGFIIHGLKLQEAFKEVTRTSKLYKDSKQDDTCDEKTLKTRKKYLFKAIVNLHFTQINFTKWVCEVVAASHDSQFHSNTKTALVASLISALVSTYSHSAKFFPTRA